MKRTNMLFVISAFALASFIVGGCKKEQAPDPSGTPATGATAGQATPTASATPAAKATPTAGKAPIVGKVDPAAKHTAQNAAKLVSGLLGNLAKAGAAATGQKPLGPVVNWRKLMPFLPNAIGAFKAAGEGSGQTAGLGGMIASTVRRTYKAGKKVLKLKIVDTAAVPMMRTAFAMARMAVQDGSDRVQKGVEVAGFPGSLEWRKAGQRGKIAVLVAGRYVVELSLKPTGSADEVLALIKTIELKKLAAIKAPTAK